MYGSLVYFFSFWGDLSFKIHTYICGISAMYMSTMRNECKSVSLCISEHALSVHAYVSMHNVRMHACMHDVRMHI